MESMYLLIPLSAVLVLVIIGIFGWALYQGQFEDLESEGARILEREAGRIDCDQAASTNPPRESPAQSGPTK